MEKVTFTFTLSKEQQEAKKQRVKALLQNPYMKEWRKQYAIDDTFIYSHSGRFQDYCDMMSKCEGCAGLSFCRQPMQGQRLELTFDGFLQTQVSACSYTLKEEKKYVHEKQYRFFDAPKEYLLIDLSKLDVSKESTSYQNVIMKVLRTLMNEENTKGLYLFGTPGVGKSYLAAGMTNYYAKKGKKVAFVNVAKLIADLKMMFHDAMAMEQKLRIIQQVDVLVLDDIGGESVTAWSRDDILLPLLDARMQGKKLTIFTSNYQLSELKDKLAQGNGRVSEPVAAERILERIRTLSCEIFVKGSSRRK